jgi:hypothetical protein
VYDSNCVHVAVVVVVVIVVVVVWFTRANDKGNTGEFSAELRAAPGLARP